MFTYARRKLLMNAGNVVYISTTYSLIALKLTEVLTSYVISITHTHVAYERVILCMYVYYIECARVYIYIYINTHVNMPYRISINCKHIVFPAIINICVFSDISFQGGCLNWY